MKVCCDRKFCAAIGLDARAAECVVTARICTRDSMQQCIVHARQSIVCAHCAHDLLVTVHCVVHCVGHCTRTLFKKKKRSLGFRASQARSKRFEVSKLLFHSNMIEGTSPMHHALKMNMGIERLGQLRFGMDHELSIDLILTSLFDSFAPFVLNYRMNNIESIIPELINMLRAVKPSLKN